ncbi:hypothetical protein [Vreelandella sp. EE22]
MKTRLLIPFALGAAGLLSLNSTQAEQFAISDARRFDAWQALTLDGGGQRHFRAVETQSYSDATLSVNTTQGICHLPWLEMRVTLEDAQPESRPVRLVPARLRVDQAPRMDTMAEFIVEENDDGFYSHFYLGELDTLLGQMSEGEQLFIGFDQGDDASPWYMTFALEGAAPAIREMQRRCSAS